MTKIGDKLNWAQVAEGQITSGPLDVKRFFHRSWINLENAVAGAGEIVVLLAADAVACRVILVAIALGDGIEIRHR